MKQWLINILDKRIGRFLFISILMIVGSSLVTISLYLIISFCIKYGMWIYIVFAFLVFISIAFILSKRRNIF